MHAGSRLWPYLLLCLTTRTISAEHLSDHQEHAKPNRTTTRIYLAYTVSAGEGFNLNRDVYIRAATMVHRIRRDHPEVDVRLRLLPWSRLPHWLHAPQSLSLPWSSFFDIKSLNSYIPVEEFVAAGEIAEVAIILPIADALYELLPLSKDGGWDFTQKDTYNFVQCPPDIVKRYENVSIANSQGVAVQVVKDVRKWITLAARRVECVSAQGKASVLKPLIVQQPNNSFVVLSRFDRMLHNKYGSPDYWICRKSMRYAPKLYSIVEQFQKTDLSAANTESRIEASLENAFINKDWASSQSANSYVALHVRRGDFVLHHRGGTLDDVCNQLFALFKVHDSGLISAIDKIFVASDELESVVPALRDCLSKQKAKLQLLSALDFPKLLPEAVDLTDGELAIVDQIIAGHARLFIGTCDSTFTMRIQEDREINGFFPNTTYNCFCNKQEQANREDYGQWSPAGPCYILRPWRMVKNDEEFFRVAFDHKPYVLVNGLNTSANTKAQSKRTNDEL